MITVLCNNYTVFMPTISDRESVLLAALQHTRNLCNCYLDQCHHLQLSQGTSSGSISDLDTEDNTDTDGYNASSSNTSSSSSNSNSNTGSLSLPSSSTDADHALGSLHHSYFCSMFRARQFLYILLSTHVIFPHEVSKCSQLGLILKCYKEDDMMHFCRNLCISPRTFDILLHFIEDHPTFHNNSNNGQWPIPYQLAIVLYWFGHFGSAVSVEAVAQWAGCSVGEVVKGIHKIMIAFLPLHDQAIHWPNMEEKQEASDSGESVSCQSWWLGFCMVDGMLIPLVSKPGHFGKQFFDHKSNYSLSLTVSDWLIDTVPY